MNEFPEDSNGAVLKCLFDAGDDLSVPREFDFGIIFPTEDAALEFAMRLLQAGFKVAVAEFEDEEFPWEVSCYPTMVPDHAEITAFEAQLDSLAKELDGRMNGWDCFVIKSAK